MITIKKYLSLVRGSILEGLAFRTSLLVSVISNLLYLVIIYFLWKAIFASSPTATVNGMTFYDTMIYLVLASAMFQFMDTFVVWSIGRDYQTGQIVECLIKPIDYQAYVFYGGIGNCIVAFVITFLPTFLIIYVVTQGSMVLGKNLLLFLLSIVFSMVVNFCVDFFVGTICLYTQSIWGVNVMKEVVVGLLSGATIPLAFFPEKLRAIVGILSASLFMIALMNFASALHFWIVGATSVMILVFKFKDYARYPITIFNKVFRLIFTFLIPIGFMAYYPSLFLLHREEICLWTYLTPFFGVVFVYLSYLFWMKGARQYSGTGS